MQNFRFLSYRNTQGFSLLEAIITLSILALGAILIIPAIGSLTIASLNEDAGKISGLIRYTYNLASLTAKTHRLVFDLNSRQITLESTDNTLYLSSTQDSKENLQTEENEIEYTGDLAAMGISENILNEAIQKRKLNTSDEKKEDDEKKELLGAFLNKNSSFSQKSNTNKFYQIDKQIILSKEIDFLGVWTQGMNDMKRKDKVYLYFFPHGYTQNSSIYLSDNKESILTLQVRPLTGQTSIQNGYINFKK